MLWLTWVSLAFALPVFPGRIAFDEVPEMPCTPPCTLCHQDLRGGRGTATRPFGIAIQDHGLVIDDADDNETNFALLHEAILAMETAAVDVDGNGVPDIEGLRTGQNPNRGENDFCGPEPEFGCLSHASRATPSLLTAGVAGLLILVRRAASARGGRRRP